MLIPDAMDLTSMDMAVQIPVGAEILDPGGSAYPFVDESIPVSMSGMDMSTSTELTVRKEETTTTYTIIFVKTEPGYVPIFAEENFDYVRSNLAKNYILMNDIALTANFEPMGSAETPFTGIFDGNGKTISNLKIRKPSGDNIGFFGGLGTSQAPNAEIRDLILVLADGDASNPSIEGDQAVGALVGFSLGQIKRVAVLGGTVKGTISVGGVVGTVHRNTATTTQSYATASVIGTLSNSYAGGLIGHNYLGTVSDSYATGTVTGDATVGGLVGNSGRIHRSYAIGKVTGNARTGGVVGGTGPTLETAYFDVVTTTQQKGQPSSDMTGITYFTVGGVVRVANDADAAAVTQSDFSHLDFVGNSEDGEDDIWYWVADGKWLILQWQNP